MLNNNPSPTLQETSMLDDYHSQEEDPIPTALIATETLTISNQWCALLNQEGWRAIPTFSGLGLRKLTHLLRPQLVLLHVNLPEESGWLTARKLRHMSPDLPIVLLKKRVTEQDQAFADFVGATELLDTRTSFHGLNEALHRSLLSLVR